MTESENARNLSVKEGCVVSLWRKDVLLRLFFQALAERGTSYKDKLVSLIIHKRCIEPRFLRFQKMREKYDRVTSVRFSNCHSLRFFHVSVFFRHMRRTSRNLIFLTKKSKSFRQNTSLCPIFIIFLFD